MRTSRIRKPLLRLVVFFAIVSSACSGGVANAPEEISTPEPSNSTELVTKTATLPTAESSEPILALEKTVLGYIDASPAVFIQPESGLVIEISKAIYDPETGGLESYQARVKYPAGTPTDLHFHDIAFNPSTGNVDAYQVRVDGNDLQGPTIQEFESRKSKLGPVIAFSVNSFAGTDPLPIVSVPCQGDSNVEYGESEGWQQVLHHVITCSDQIYTMEYSGYIYDNQMGTLSGYAVSIEITQ